MGYNVKHIGIVSGMDEVQITADTASDVPIAHNNWAAGSWLHVLENGGSLYTLGTDRTWYPQGFTESTDAVTTEETAQTMAAYSPEEFDDMMAVEPDTTEPETTEETEPEVQDETV